MAKVTVTFDASDLPPANKYALLADLALALDKYGVKDYEVKENAVDWQDFSDIKVVVDNATPVVKDIGQAIVDELSRLKNQRPPRT